MGKRIQGAFIITLFLGTACSLAANYSDPMDGIFRGVYGNTISVEVPSLVSKSPVAEPQNGILSFEVNPNTAYSNFEQLTDLKNGDRVSVKYTQGTDKSNILLATQITKLDSTIVTNQVSPQYTTPGSVQSPTVTQTVITTTTSHGP